MKFGDPLDLTQNEIRNAVVQQLSSAPSTPVKGQIYYLTGSNVAYVYNGTQGRPLDAAALTDGSIQIAALAVNPLVRTNQIGTQLSATISDLVTTVQSYPLSSFAAPTTTVNLGTQRLTNAAQATNATDVPTLAQVQNLITAGVQGQTSIKNPVRAFSNSNIALSGTQSIDGVALSIGDSVAAGAQTIGTENNIYVVAAGAWAIRSDCVSGGQWSEGTEFLVTEGNTYAGAIFRQTTSGTLTIGTSTLEFTQGSKINQYVGDNTTVVLDGMVFSVSYNSTLSTTDGQLGINTNEVVRKYTTTIACDGATTTFNVTHGLGTTFVYGVVHDSLGNIYYPDQNPANSSTITFTINPAPSNTTTLNVLVIG